MVYNPNTCFLTAKKSGKNWFELSLVSTTTNKHKPFKKLKGFFVLPWCKHGVNLSEFPFFYF